MANTNLLRMVSSDPNDRRFSGAGKPLPYELKSTVAPNIGDTAHRILAKQSGLQKDYNETDIQIVTMELSTLGRDKDSWNDIKAAVSVGNLDSAGNVSYIAHGINTNPERSSDNHIGAAEGLYKHAKYSGATNHAAVAWMNYEAPEGPPSTAVWSNEKTHAGGHRFAQDLDALNTVRGGQEAIRLNAVGHSYGSGVMVSALTEMRTTVDSATALASSGIDKDQAEAVNNGEITLAIEDNPYRPGAINFYYTDTSKDNIYRWGQVPASKVDPSQLEGATRFSSGKDPAGVYEDVDGHDLFREEGDRKQGYLSNTTARRDLAFIVNGQENLITVEEPAP